MHACKGFCKVIPVSRDCNVLNGFNIYTIALQESHLHSGEMFDLQLSALRNRQKRNFFLFRTGTIIFVETAKLVVPGDNKLLDLHRIRIHLILPTWAWISQYWFL